MRTALVHREPDRVPGDLGGTRFSGIHARAYRALRPALGLPERESRIADLSRHLALLEDDAWEPWALTSEASGCARRRPGGRNRSWRGTSSPSVTGGAGGGFIFVAVHDMQADVPPEHVLAMRQVIEGRGRYG